MAIYNAPNGAKSSIDIGTPEGEQLNLWHYQRKAIIDIRNDMVFQQLTGTTVMPKNFGKKIKKYHYIPLLDNRNINDQGIDAAGAVITTTQYFVQYPELVLSIANASKAAAAAAINDNINNAGSAETVAVAGADNSGGTGFATLTLTDINIKYATEAKTTTILAFDLGAIAFQGSGNLYGSSKDIGVISKKLPMLSESGGRVNRVGHSRVTVQGTIENQGMFFDYTEDSIQFDTDKELLSHMMTESVVGANEMLEDNVQSDLLAAADVIMYGGVAAQNSDITAEGSDPSVLTYDGLIRLSIQLDNNRCPKHTKYIKGSTLVDTRVVNNARFIYVGSELLPAFMALTDYHAGSAWKSVETYADAGNIVAGEAGAVGPFRIIVVNEMQRYSGAGGAVGTNPGYYETNGRYDVLPMLVVGSGAFTTISFHSSGNSAKFSIIHKKPGPEAATLLDPYGKAGFYSIQWWYGSLVERPEWIAIYKVVAPM